MYTSILEKAAREEEARRKASYQELTKLEQIIKHNHLNDETNLDISLLDKLNELLTQDKAFLAKLKKDIKALSPHPALKYNKLSEIFTCSEDIIKNHSNEAIAGNLLLQYPINPEEKTILGGTKNAEGNIINYAGTSQPNCIQNVYLLLLRIITKQESITKILELQEANIYNPDTSPNLQATKLPDSFDGSSYSHWFYLYQNNDSTSQYELLAPGFGYAFGGSRADSRYTDKQFRFEDCSSALAKWLNAEAPFITSSMKAVFENSLNYDDAHHQAAYKTLRPLSDNTNAGNYMPSTGDIFFFTGHTGVVSNIFPNEYLIETLSYARNMPDIEGLGYKNYSLTEKDFLYFEARVALHEEL